MKSNFSRIITFFLALVIAVMPIGSSAFAASVSKEALDIIDVNSIQDNDSFTSNYYETKKEVELPTRATWLTGRFNGGRNWTTDHVFATNNSSKTSKFQVYTYNAMGNQTPGMVDIYVQSKNGAYKKTFSNIKSGSTISLPSGHTGFYVYIRRASTSSVNTNHTYYWAFKATQNGTWAW